MIERSESYHVSGRGHCVSEAACEVSDCMGIYLNDPRVGAFTPILNVVSYDSSALRAAIGFWLLWEIFPPMTRSFIAV